MAATTVANNVQWLGETARSVPKSKAGRVTLVETVMVCLTRTLALATLGALVLTAPAVAQVEPERCPRFVAWNEAPIPASLNVAALQEGEVRLTFIGHASFYIESPLGVTAVTDYSASTRPPTIPDIVTMNRAHISHYTNNPDPGIRYVLRGWGEDDVPAKHDVTVDDVWIRNVTTNVRGGFGTSATLQRDQNSMFVFEVSGLCIAHLGHLHHTLTPAHLAALGRIDVVLAPVDGGYTLNVNDMITVLKQINAPLIIPMHYFGTASLQRFVTNLSEDFAVETNPLPVVTLSRATLPRVQTLLIVPEG
ncbi:MBL fold metallo-hydrolase [Bauldia sp.]|uniref:MBL fold metallo-hydrolase n=1 Tax=Bauldia sp. TaxID=2575872 RepID=UPI003BAB6F77